MTEERVNDALKWFIGLVETRREIDPGDVPGLTEGRIYSGRQAVQYKLADQIGDELAARNWLVKERGVQRGLRIRQWKPQAEESGFLGLVMNSLASAFGVSGSKVTALLSQATAVLELDGLVSVWHPASR